MDVSTTDTSSAPFDLTVHTGGDTFLVSGPVPELSWKLPHTVAVQQGYELEAEVDGERLSFAENGPRHLFIAWPWRELTSTVRVRWRVRVRHEGGRSAWSDWSAFEAGLFEDDWSASWITAPVDAEAPVGQRPAYEFSSRFTMDDVVGTARLYAAALGVYDVYINGHQAGAAELMPGSASYDKTLYAQAIDVTGNLVQGENTILVRLADGWFRGRMGAFRTQALWGPRTALRAELHFRADGASSVLVSSAPTWQVAEGSITRADLMDGQVEDLQRAPRPLGSAVLLYETPPAVSWSPAPPVRVTTELAPVWIDRIGQNDAVVDFGQNASGRVRLTALGPAGATTRLVFGEHVGRDGAVTLDHLDSPTPDGGVVRFEQADEVISDGAASVFEPHHTVHGFQYVQVHRTDLNLQESDLTMQVLHTDFRPVGGFSCDNDDLNQLWEVAKWSFRGNAVDVPTDCPTRERAGWTGDWQIFLPTAERLYDVDGFSRKWLQSVRDDQLADGRIVNISPDPVRLQSFPDANVDFATGSAGWGDAAVLVPWELYRTYGDTRVLADNWDTMTRWVQFALHAAADNRHPSRIERSAEPLPHEQYVWDGTFHFGEWLEPTPIAEDGTPGPTMPDPMAWATADKGEVGTAYLYRSVSTLAQIGEVLGRSQEAERYAGLATKILGAWRTEFIDADGRTPGNTQASYVRALAFALVPDDLRARAAQHLAELITAGDDHLGTGFLSTADLLPVLADSGYADLAYRLLLQRTSPSWLGMLDRGATTIWEEWEGVDRNGNAHASLNHYSKGAVIRYLHSHVLGLQPDAAAVGWDAFTIAPTVPEGMTWAKGHFDSPQGTIRTEWRIDDQDAVLTVVVPGGASATLRWGDHHSTVGPGRHEVQVFAATLR